MTEIDARKPYLIKWTTTGDPITSPTFFGSYIESSSPRTVTSADNKVNFIGNYDPVNLAAGQGTYYLGTNNQLYYPSTGRTMNAFRAYFTVDLDNGGSSAPQQVRSFVMNIGGEETTGVALIDNGKLIIDNVSDAWYDLQGRKVARSASPLGSSKNGQWSMVNGQLKKGIYIYNGKKVAIK